MARYRKRSDGRYVKQIKIGVQPNGKPKYKSLYGRTQQELDKKIADYQALLNKGIVVDDKNLTLGSWAETWLATYKKGFRPGTYEVYYYVVLKHFETIKHIRLNRLTPAHIQGVINGLQGHRRTQEKFLLTIKQVLNKAIENDYIYRNVADNISLPPKQKVEKRALTDKEKTDIFALKLPVATHAFLGIILYCGLRRGEAWALYKNDIDFKNKTIRVNKTVYRDKGMKIGSPKTNAANRVIPMPDDLINILKPYIRGRKSIFVFGDDDKLMTQRQFQSMWKEFVSLYNVSKGGSDDIRAIAGDITPHIFRHTYATMLYYAGVDIKTAQYLLGHTSITVTLNIYTHLEKGNLSETGTKLNEFLKQKSVKNQSDEKAN